MTNEYYFHSKCKLALLVFVYANEITGIIFPVSNFEKSEILITLVSTSDV